MKKLKPFFVLFLIVSIINGIFSINTKADTPSALSNADPVIVLTNYELIDGSYETGSTFTLKLTATNCNHYADAYNVIIDVSTEDLSLRLGDGSVSEVYFETIKAGSSVTFEQTFSIEDEYPYQTAMLTYDFKYYDQSAKVYSNQTVITPRVIAACKLNINVLSVAESASIGSRSLVNVRCTNDGAVDISDIKIILDGNIDESQKTIDLGALKSGEQLMKDCYVNFLEEGKQSLSVAFEYEDTDGNKFTIDKKTYDVEVNPSQLISVDNNNSGKTFSIIWLAIAVMLNIAIIYTVVRKSKKKKARKEQNGNGQ